MAKNKSLKSGFNNAGRHPSAPAAPRPVPVSAHDKHNFFHAVKNNHVHDIKKFIDKHSDAASLRQDGRIALQDAVDRKHYSAMTTLLDAGADPNALSNDRKDGVLFTAARVDRPDLLGLLLHKGGHAWQTLDDGTTLMMHAARHDSPKTIAMLFGRGHIGSAENKQGNACLHIAAENNSGKAINALAAGGEDINRKNAAGDTPFIIAVRAQKLDAMRALLENGADYKLTDAKGRTAADIAARFKHDPDTTFFDDFTELMDQRDARDNARYHAPFHDGTPDDIKIKKPVTIRPRRP